jgi:hypothetical protein
MKPWFRAIAVVALLTPAAGCSIYFGDDDDDGDDTCEEWDDGGAFPAQGLRNPYNGACEFQGGGCGCGGCPPYGDAEAEPAPLPNWATCPGACEGLDELTCLATADCRAAYTGGWCPPWADCAEPQQAFLECWGTAPGVITTDQCWGLDAESCSYSDACSAVYTSDSSGQLAFLGCQPESQPQGCYSDAECPMGYECTADTMCEVPPGDCDPTVPDCQSPMPPVCYGQCVPSQNSCENVDCGMGYHCEEQCYPPDPDGDGILEDGVPADYCEPVCVPDWNTCSAIDCGPGYECVEVCYPCDSPDGMGCPPICQPECVPILTCDNVLCGDGYHCELQCAPDPGDPTLPPTDPTDPPTMDGCYPVCVPDTQSTCDLIMCPVGEHCEETCVVGPCLPDGTCPPPVCDAQCVPDQPTVTCESIQTEMACLAEPSCVPVYTGDDCTCYPWGCECTTLVWDHCETGWVVDPMQRVGVRGRLAERALANASALAD